MDAIFLAVSSSGNVLYTSWKFEFIVIDIVNSFQLDVAMLSYITQRLLLMIPTLFGIMVINFCIVQIAPGGPVEQMIAQLTRGGGDALSRISGSGRETSSPSIINNQLSMSDESINSKYRGAQGLDPELVAEIEKRFGFDKPAHERFWEMIKNYVQFDFGDSFFRNASVTGLILSKLPVSISLGVWTTLLTYLISIPLGIRKAVKDGSHFDIISSMVIVIAYSIPSFLFAILLIVLFAGGNYWQIFPLKGMVSEQFDQLDLIGKIGDYAMHMVLPVSAMILSGFASLTMLCKNSFLDEINKQYVLTARAKGASEYRVLYGHIFRNAMLIVISSLPDALLKILFTGSLLIEMIFSLDGLGLLAFESVMTRDYPVVFGSLYIFTLIGLIANLLGDIIYMMVDPRINFAKRPL